MCLAFHPFVEGSGGPDGPRVRVGPRGGAEPQAPACPAACAAAGGAPRPAGPTSSLRGPPRHERPRPRAAQRGLPGPVGDDGTTRKYFSAGAKGGRVSHFIAVRVPRLDQRAANATPGTANADPSKQPGGQQRIRLGNRASTDTLSLWAGRAAAAGAGSTEGGAKRGNLCGEAPQRPWMSRPSAPPTSRCTPAPRGGGQRNSGP